MICRIFPAIRSNYFPCPLSNDSNISCPLTNRRNNLDPNPAYLAKALLHATTFGFRLTCARATKLWSCPLASKPPSPGPACGISCQKCKAWSQLLQLRMAALQKITSWQWWPKREQPANGCENPSCIKDARTLAILCNQSRHTILGHPFRGRKDPSLERRNIRKCWFGLVDDKFKGACCNLNRLKTTQFWNWSRIQSGNFQETNLKVQIWT